MSQTLAVLGQFGDAIDFIFDERESPAGGAQVGGRAGPWELMWEHLKLSGVAMAIAHEVCATDAHVRVAVGLDYLGAASLPSTPRTSAARCRASR